MKTKSAWEQWGELNDEDARRVAAHKAVPVGTPERTASLADLETWRAEVYRPADARLWPLVVKEGNGFNL